MPPREWLRGFSKRFSGPLNAGFEFLYADPNQSLANRTLDAAAAYGGWKAGVASGAALGLGVGGPPGGFFGGIAGGLLFSQGGTRAMDAFQEGVKNLPAPKSGGLLGLNEPLINQEAAQKFDASRRSGYGSLPSSVNTKPEYYDSSVTLWKGDKGSRSSPPPSLNPEVPQTGTQTGGRNIYAGMSEQEIKDAYDRLRYGDNFDKARDYMKKGQGDPFDSTYNPSKYLVDEAGQKKAVEEGMKMHEAFFGPGGGRSRQLSNPTSSSSASITPARGSGMRNEGSATKEKPFGTDFSGPLQNNTRGSDSFDRDKTPVRGMPTSEDHRKRQRSLRTVQKRLEENQVQRNLNQYSPVQYYTGDTGHSTGPHLDMRVWSHEKGAFVDPTEFMKYLSVGGKPVGDQFRMSSPYGMRDLYKNGNEKMHHGIDYATPEMTPIDVMGEYLTTYNDPGGGITSQYQIPGFDLILMHGHNKNKVLTPSYVTDGISRYGA